MSGYPERMSQPSHNAPGRVGAFFDLDQTLVRGASTWFVVRTLVRHVHVDPGTVLFALRRTFSYDLFGEGRGASHMDTVVRRAACAVDGQDEDRMRSLVEEVWQTSLAPRLYARSVERLRHHVDLGHEVWIVTASPWLVAECAAAHLGATGGRGTRLRVVDHRITADLEGHVVHGGRKAEAVAQIAADRGIDLARSWAYSDSCQDTPLLESVGHPVAVNADRHLRRTARARGWERLTSRTRADATRSHLLQVGATLVACVGAAGLVTLVLTALPLR